MFLQRIEFEVEEKTIECNELNNEILIIKKIVKEEKYVKVKENQLAILNQNGKILDLRGEPGLYEIKEGKGNITEYYCDDNLPHYSIIYKQQQSCNNKHN